MKSRQKKLLFQILSQPASPYREVLVAQTIQAALKKSLVPYFLDPVGNIVVGARSQREYLRKIQAKTREPLRVFIAHMDHPGFHGEKWISPTRLHVRWHGGSPTRHIVGAPVWIANSEGAIQAQASFSQVKMNSAGTAIESGVITFRKSPVNLSKSEPNAKKLFGGFSFRAPVWEKNSVIYTKAADDLVGAFAITTLAQDILKNAKKFKNFIGILTRAEEVGFIGCIGHLELGWLQKAKRPVLCISLETSRTLPGAIIGKGPVIRLGDRSTVFDPGYLKVFRALAQKALPGAHQARVMDGGTCEATAVTSYGFRSVGISIPLGNYHNQSFEGGPDSRGPLGPAPEFVHLDDVSGLIDLSHALMTPGDPRWSQPWAENLARFKKLWREAQPLLRY